MKTQRFTLEEIRERLNLLDGHLPEKGKEISRGTINADFIKEQLKQLESQLAQLQPAVANLDANQTAALSKQILLQSMALAQTLIIYINEIMPMM
ncbi:hypothetical protein [Desulfocucumis palustris]|nr:hypothetical protein [Desulfocucumis palustris]